MLIIHIQILIEQHFHFQMLILFNIANKQATYIQRHQLKEYNDYDCNYSKQCIKVYLEYCLFLCNLQDLQSQVGKELERKKYFSYDVCEYTVTQYISISQIYIFHSENREAYFKWSNFIQKMEKATWGSRVQKMNRDVTNSNFARYQ